MTKFFISLFAAIILAACGNRHQNSSDSEIKIDGSSTVYPISEAVAEDYRDIDKDIDITVGLSGTGGGFKKFGRGEADMCDASRPISDGEASACKISGIDFIELPIAYDGIVIVVNKDNKWLDKITVAELKKMWEPGAQNKIKKWNQINPLWPNEECHLFGAGTASGTFDYFTEAINGKTKSIRGDYTASANPNVLIEGITNDKNALGFFGLAYYESSKEKLKVIPLDDEKKENGEGPIMPSAETIKNGTYQPLSRPLFIYVSKKAAAKNKVQSFVDFYIAHAAQLSTEVGYVAMPDEVYALVKRRWAAQTTGSMMTGVNAIGAQMEGLLNGGK